MRIKSLLTSLLFSAAALSANAEYVTNLWTGSNDLGAWSWDKTIVLDKSLFANVQNWDFIRVTVTDVDEANINNYPQYGVRIETTNYPLLDWTANVSVTAPCVTDIRVSPDGAVGLSTYGARIQGAYCTISQIDLVTGVDVENENLFWTGEVVIPTDWSNYLTLAHSCFKNVESGLTIRVHTKNLQAGATGIIQYAASNYAWTTFDDVEYVSLGGSYFDIDVTESMVTHLKGESGEQGVIISGCGYTIIGVEIIDLSGVVVPGVTVDYTNLVFIGDEPNPTLNLSVVYAEGEEQDETVVRVDTFNDYLESISSNSITVTDPTTISISLPVDINYGVYRYDLYVNGEYVESCNFVLNPETPG